jgi:hypothetical protein
MCVAPELNSGSDRSRLQELFAEILDRRRVVNPHTSLLHFLRFLNRHVEPRTHTAVGVDGAVLTTTIL